MVAVVDAGDGRGHGVAGVAGGGGGGDGGGEGDGHEAQAFALEVLHGGTHVLLHELGHLVLRHRQAVVGGGRLCPVTAPRARPTCLYTVATSLPIQIAIKLNIH